MTTSTTPRGRSLRVGIVISGQLVEERFFAPATEVTLGQSLRCDLSIPVDGVPREHVLFGADGSLTPPPGAEVVGSRARGKLTLGDLTILFQEVATPAPAPRMQLPPALRSSLADRIDRRLAVIIGGSLLAHLALAGYAWMQDRPQPLLASYTGPQYEEINITVPDFIAPPTTDNDNTGVATPATPSQTPRPIVTPTRITNVPKPAQPIDSERLANILTGGDGEIGKGGMAGRQTGATLDQQIQDAKDSGAKIGDNTHTSRVDDHANVANTDRTITDTDPTLTQTPRPTHNEPTGRVIPGHVKPEDDTTLTPAMVLQRINTLYMGGLQRCYRYGLATDSTLSGKVALAFTVDERGQVIDEDASGVSTEVDACIGKQMRAWRFPIPHDDKGKPTDASFTVTLALQPS